MKLALCLLILWASGGWAADEAADRAAIGIVISTLNNSPASTALFTGDFADGGILASLGVDRTNAPGAIRIGGMCVSHEPMGETHSCPPAKTARFTMQSVRIITPDVALVDAVTDRDAAGAARYVPVLLVLRKEAEVWKIASVRAVAQAGQPIAQ